MLQILQGSFPSETKHNYKSQPPVPVLERAMKQNKTQRQKEWRLILFSLKRAEWSLELANVIIWKVKLAGYLTEAENKSHFQHTRWCCQWGSSFLAVANRTDIWAASFTPESKKESWHQLISKHQEKQNLKCCLIRLCWPSRCFQWVWKTSITSSECLMPSVQSIQAAPKTRET